MNVQQAPSYGTPPANQKNSWNRHITVITILTAGLALIVILWFAIVSSDNSNTQIPPVTTHSAYPIGTIDSAEPSGLAPPGINSLPGYTRSYVNDFLGTRVPPGWDVFSGVPGGDPGALFASSHVVVSNGLLHLNTFRDPKYQNEWVTGGICQCGFAQTYGAYFVRSRVTAAGPNEVELLWPQDNQWPPELDFSETGGAINSTSSTVHFSTANSIDQRSIIINMSLWHTWGVVWSPTKILYIVDGQVWGSINVVYAIPSIPMTLDMEQRTECALGRQCPSQPVSMLVDWVAEYTPKLTSSS
jgi:hypothetical protein